MIRVLALIAGGAAFSMQALAAQDDPPAEGGDDELLGLEEAIDLGLGDEAEMGWTTIPRPLPDRPDGELSELERLSKSPSGVTFGLDAYDAKSDNPLVPVSVTLRALDKITATYKDIEIPIGEQAEFGPLTLLPRTCDKRPPEETPETTVFLEVFAGEGDVELQRVRDARKEEEGVETTTPMSDSSSIVLPGEEMDEEEVSGDAIFRGWMFASSPSLNGMEHPVYDVWVIDCKMVEPGN